MCTFIPVVVSSTLALQSVIIYEFDRGYSRFPFKDGARGKWDLNKGGGNFIKSKGHRVIPVYVPLGFAQFSKLSFSGVQSLAVELLCQSLCHADKLRNIGGCINTLCQTNQIRTIGGRREPVFLSSAL